MFRWKSYYHNELFARAFDGLAARRHTLGSGPCHRGSYAPARREAAGGEKEEGGRRRPVRVESLAPPRQAAWGPDTDKPTTDKPKLAGYRNTGTVAYVVWWV